MRKAISPLYFFLAILFTISLFVVGIIEKFLPLLRHAAYYCQTVIKTNITLIPHYISILPLLIAFLIVSRAIIKLLLIYVYSKRFKHTLTKKIVYQSRVERISNKLGLNKSVTVVSYQKPIAFCLGLLTSQIYISTSLVQLLSDSELEAVLRHEQYHKENNDNITMTLASVVQSLLPFFPLIAIVIKKYRIDREIQADNFATMKIGTNEPIISALNKLLVFQNPAHVSFSNMIESDTLEPRIETLINGSYSKRKHSVKGVVFNLLFICFFTLIFSIPIQAEELHHNEHDVLILCSDEGSCMKSCTSDRNLNVLYSEMQSNNYSAYSSHPVSQTKL